MPASPKDIAAATKKMEGSFKAWDKARKELDKANSDIVKYQSILSRGVPSKPEQAAKVMPKMAQASAEMSKIMIKLHKLQKNAYVTQQKYDDDMRKLNKLLDQK